MKKITANSREIMFLSISLFFLLSSGLIAKWYWSDDPLLHIGDRLLAKDGDLLLKILSDKRMLKTLRYLTESDPQEKSVSQYVTDRLLDKDAKLLKSLTISMLQNKVIHQTIIELSSSPNSKNSKSLPQKQDDWSLLGKYIIDQLMKKDAHLLVSIGTKLLPIVMQETQTKPNKTTLASDEKSRRIKQKELFKLIRTSTNKIIDHFLAHDGKLLTSIGTKLLPVIMKNSQTKSNKTMLVSNKKQQQTNQKELFKLIDSLGQKIVDRFLAKNGKLLTSVGIKIILAMRDQRTKKGQNNFLEKNALAEKLGKYAIDQLLRARARSLRAILQDIVGAEIMRLLRESRQIVQNVKQQIKQLQIETLLKKVAFSTGKGALEGFLQNQQLEKQLKRRKKLTFIKELPLFRKKLLSHFPCVMPIKENWISRENNNLQIIIGIKKNKLCSARHCNKLKAQVLAWLKQQKYLTFQMEDLHLIFYPDCIAYQKPQTKKNLPTSKKTRSPLEKLKSQIYLFDPSK